MRFPLTLGYICLLVTSVAMASEVSDQKLQDRLQAHIEFLADDLMLGRQPGSDGYNIAANYVTSQYRQMGLLPAGDGGTYFQQVPLRRAFLESGSAEIVFSFLIFLFSFYISIFSFFTFLPS